ncbi:MAG: hypothetical protein M3Q18_12580 [Actinomycetota bacterium]|nr:hypothetical protein [Actinomycetota bacterium]
MMDAKDHKWPGLERLGEMPEWLARLDNDIEVQAALSDAIGGLQSAKLSRMRLKREWWTAGCSVAVDGEEGVKHLAATIVPPGHVEPSLAPAPGRPGDEDWRCWVPRLRLELTSAEPEAKLAALGLLTDPERARALLEGAIRAGTPAYSDMRIVSAAPKVMRYSPGSRCTVLYRLDLPEGAADRKWPDVVVAKTYHRADKGRIAWDGMRSLWQSPLARSEVVTIAEPLAWLPEQKILVQGPIPESRTLKELLLATFASRSEASDELRGRLAKTAAGLAELHHSGAASVEQTTWEEELAEVREVLGRLTATLPHLDGAADPWLVHLELLADKSPVDPSVAAHRSFRPAQVLLHGEGLGFIDFDGFCRAEPALDIALFRATTRDLAMSVLAPELPLETRLAAIDNLSEHFLACYEELAPVSRDRVALWEALDLFTNVLHSWTKVKPARLAYSLALLQHHQACLPGLGA